MRTAMRWVLGGLVAAVVVGVPTAYYRSSYNHARRLREVAPNKLYRSGELTASGFREAIYRYDIGTVINLQDEFPDPLLPESWNAKPSIRESEVCKSLNVQFVWIKGGNLEGDPRPAVIDDFLDILDDPVRYPPPYLIHCHAGRDRTGLMVGIYRMEYENRSKADAMRELKANGFATFAATDGNFYVEKFILKYDRTQRRKKTGTP